MNDKGLITDEDVVEYSLSSGEMIPTSVSNLISTSNKLKNKDHDIDQEENEDIE